MYPYLATSNFYFINTNSKLLIFWFHFINYISFFFSVTYLSDCGAPTIIVDKPGTDTSDVDFCDYLENSLYIISKPKLNKHVYFKGDLLHAASTDIITEEEVEEDDSDSESESESESESQNHSRSENSSSNIQLDNESHPLRITFLVNIWLDHKPVNSIPANDSLISKLNSYPKNVKLCFTDSNDIKKLDILNDSRNCTWSFMSSDIACNITLPAPSLTTIHENFKEVSNLIVCLDNLDKIANIEEVILCVECADEDDDDDDGDDHDDDDDGDGDEVDDDNHSDGPGTIRCLICNRRAENVGPRRGFDYKNNYCGGCVELSGSDDDDDNDDDDNGYGGNNFVDNEISEGSWDEDDDHADDNINDQKYTKNISDSEQKERLNIKRQKI
jgi:hypothetical protein